MRLRRFLKIENYKSRLRLISRQLKIKKLERIKAEPQVVNYIWLVDKNITDQKESFDKFGFSIFGTEIDFDNINWHKDYQSNFIYPMFRFDKLKLDQWYDQGIDVKFPWELSRFYFGVNLGQRFLLTRHQVYYETFRKLVLDWIDNNQFLYGVNWVSTMETAIRAMNWIISLNFLSEALDEDEEFRNRISNSLAQHAEYIYAFPEIYENNLTTNHTTAGFAGLLFLGLALKNHPKSSAWIETAVNGLEKCMEKQVYNDGGNFEGSIAYHRLVLEFFAYSAIAALSNGISLSKNYYSKLFRMFEFTSAYMDQNCKAPQVGDNDSGRCLILNGIENENQYSSELDHSYLLAIGEHIFNYPFMLQCRKKHSLIFKFLPDLKKVSTKEINVTPIRTDTSVCFPNTGAYFLKNDLCSLVLACFPLGQNGKGGHNHLDIGSFTFSIRDNPIIVDAGTLTYTANKNLRNKFRAYPYHNTLYTELDDKIDLKTEDLWSLKNYYKHQILKYTSNELEISINFETDEKTRFRKFRLEKNELMIEDKYNGIFYSRINLHPDILIIDQQKNRIEFENFELNFINVLNYKVKEYDYSPHYSKSVKSKCIIFSSDGFLSINLSLKL